MMLKEMRSFQPSMSAMPSLAHLDGHSVSVTGADGTKLELRGVRIQNKRKKKNQSSDEPVCIALSSDEDEDEEDGDNEGAAKGDAAGEGKACSSPC